MDSKLSRSGPRSGRGQGAVVGWLDERFPLVQSVDAELYRRVPNYASAFYRYLGGLALIILFIEFLTGFLLGVYYVPDGAGQPAGIRGVHLQDVEGEALRCLRSDAGQATQLLDQILDRSCEHPASAHPRQAHASGQGAEALVGQSLLRPQPVVEGGPQQILEHARVLGIHRLRVDAHPADLLAGELDLDGAAARRTLDHRQRQLLLGLRQLGLHLLDLLHHLVHVHFSLRPPMGLRSLVVRLLHYLGGKPLPDQVDRVLRRGNADHGLVIISHLVR